MFSVHPCMFQGDSKFQNVDHFVKSWTSRLSLAIYNDVKMQIKCETDSLTMLTVVGLDKHLLVFESNKWS